ncbi:Helicase HerA, central domain containing protein [Burkholderiaceae bacterium]
MINHVSFGPSNYLGPVISAHYDHVEVLANLHAQPDTQGLTRGSFVVMVRHTHAGTPFQEALQAPHTEDVSRAEFTVLRLRDVKSTLELSEPPLRHCHRLVAATPGCDALSLSVLSFEVLGTLLLDATGANGFRFSGDSGRLGHASRYCAFMPCQLMLAIILNGTVPSGQRINLGVLRESETHVHTQQPQPIYLSMGDVRGKRTAMFGKTRLGKSNVVKLLVQGMLDITVHDHSVGQLIFDVNGEYANDNPQDGGSIASSYRDRSGVYFLTDRGGNADGKLLRFNFFEQTDKALEIMRELLPESTVATDYVRTLLNCRLPELVRDPRMSEDLALRVLRKIMLFWTILHEAGFDHDESRLLQILNQTGFKSLLNPCFPQALRLAAYQAINGQPAPAPPKSFVDMCAEMRVIAKFALSYGNDPCLMRNGVFLFELDEMIMARFLSPNTSDGPFVLRPCMPFHAPMADGFTDEILQALHVGKTVIVDLGGANEKIIRYFAKTLSVAVFHAQEQKFVNNALNDRYVQIYFEEAHMIFPSSASNVIDVYSRFAKEGAKFNIGIVYSTQSPSTVNEDLLAQTENFFIGHLSSDREAARLASVQFAFKGCEQDIMRMRTPGLMRMLAYSNRYLIPVQAARYKGQSRCVDAP